MLAEHSFTLALFCHSSMLSHMITCSFFGMSHRFLGGGAKRQYFVFYIFNFFLMQCLEESSSKLYHGETNTVDILMK